MAHIHHPQVVEAPRTAERNAAGRVALAVLALFAGALFAAAALLWQRYGATVFFDILNAGIASCL
ncbi:hypothetical protein EZH22_11045 [Xanthobacter dioxanivorans]|uniref:Uncharacterized protein n=1 Tax=Xanthobacter dioxanivorans TaxID=2528964 RepID=A0A974PUU4_9HYPH|nr:hypothetical protein [Xanthobacter dioxanivorans]QRG09931.1 hypothetical protein EZH22_11045 [Xanthobacter dioxanivorans]